MTEIKLGSLVRVNVIRARGRRAGPSKGTTGLLLGSKTITTKKGEEFRYEVRLNNSTRSIMLGIDQFTVLGHPDTEPELFI